VNITEGVTGHFLDCKRLVGPRTIRSMGGETMPLWIHSMGACLIVALPPVVDSPHLAEVRGPLQGEVRGPLQGEVWAYRPRPEVVILDLSPVQFIDSPGVQLINETRQQGRARGIGVRIVAPTPAQRDILMQLGVEPEALYSSVPQALVYNDADRAHVQVEDDGGSRRPVGTGDQVPEQRPKTKGESSPLR
jgi:anti-anti-sigma regulatory factor